MAVRGEHVLVSYQDWPGYETNTCIHIPLVSISYFCCCIGTISDNVLCIPTWASHIHAWKPESNLNESIQVLCFDGEDFRISLQDRSWEWGELSLENQCLWWWRGNNGLTVLSFSLPHLPEFFEPLGCPKPLAANHTHQDPLICGSITWRWGLH